MKGWDADEATVQGVVSVDVGADKVALFFDDF